jgi:hypothetical protein
MNKNVMNPKRKKLKNRPDTLFLSSFSFSPFFHVPFHQMLMLCFLMCYLYINKFLTNVQGKKRGRVTRQKETA